METIVAISTAPVSGGIGIIRISGDKAFEILLKIFKSNTVKKEEDIKRNTIVYGHIIDENKAIVDEVLVSFFKSPNSYTKENIVEINSHGGIVVMKKILDICIKNGARLASPGEFTKRAFLNGRIDLSQVEAVATIIGANSEEELKASNKILSGKLKNQIDDIKEKILEVLSLLEVNIDYPEYDVPEVNIQKVNKSMNEVLEKLKNLEQTFGIGDKIRDGISVAIIGTPNSGKSSLLNYILDDERAIVTDIEGTTRDTIEEIINISGMPVRIIDTAGIRKTNEKVEKIGIEKSLKIAKTSDIVLAIFDISKPLNEDDKNVLKMCNDENTIIILNKIDLQEKAEIEEISKKFSNIIKVSVLKKQNIEKILKKLSNMISTFNVIDKAQDSLVIIHERQKKIIKESIILIEKILKENIEKVPIDILSLEIQDLLEKILEITGENVKQEMLNDIFSKFCLGK